MGGKEDMPFLNEYTKNKFGGKKMQKLTKIEIF
jgi:hypothetical protein